MSSDSSKETPTNVQVAVRCRPANAQEKSSGQVMCVNTETAERKVNVQCGPSGKKTSKTFSFDRVFGTYSTQEEVFRQMVLPLVQETVAGFNCTVFAYGQTGTGKTHTMEGDLHSEENAGIVPRAVKAILEQLEQAKVEFTIRVSFLELYNEELQDLLAPTNSEKKLKLCEVEKKGVVCQNLEEITVLSKDDIFQILERGILQRQTAATLCNKNSSRSHSIFTMKIMIKECNVDGEEVVRHGQLNLVDLAGSECVGRSGAKNDRAREAGSINQSLLTLGRVITALVDHHGHVPYRDSKLTRLLQESLGGKAKTCIIATLSPAQNAVEETLSTLDYAHRAKNIKNTPQVNQKMTKKTVMKEYCEEIESLRLQLQANREKNGIYVQPDIFYGMETKITSQEAQISEVESVLKLKIEEAKEAALKRDEAVEQLTVTQKELDVTSTHLQKTSETLTETKSQLQETTTELEASMAVIGEMDTTEEGLLRTGNELQDEVAQQRSDRTKLFTKIDKLKSNDQSRLEKTNTFVCSVMTETDSMCASVSSMLANNEEQSAKLCNGVNEMLSRGRDTCSSVKDCIDGAVQKLVDKANSDQTIPSALGQLNTQMSSSVGGVLTDLQNIQMNLSNWLSDVEASMKSTQMLLQKQAEHSANLRTSFGENASKMKTVIETFDIEHKKHIAKCVEATSAIEQDLTLDITKQQKSVQSSVASMQQCMQTQAEEMQRNMSQMIEAMLKSSQEQLTSMATAANTSNELMKKNVSAKVSEAQEAHGAASEHASQTVHRLGEAAESFSESGLSAISSISDSGMKANETTEGVFKTIDSKKSEFSDIIKSVVENTERSHNDATKTVSSAGEKVNNLLSEIKSAAEDMNKASSTSIDNFSDFMDGEGAVVRAEVADHFESLVSFLNNSSAAITNVSTETTAFKESMLECVVPVTGMTPTKRVVSENDAVLAELPRTRDHDVIRQEHRNTVAANIVAEDSISTEVQKLEVASKTEAVQDIPVATEDVSVTVDTEQEPPSAAQSPVKVAEISPTTAPAVGNENMSPNRTKSSRSSSRTGLSTKTSGIVRPRSSSRATTST